MAVRLHCIVEGQIEEAFVNQILKLHLANRSIWVDVRYVMTGARHERTYRGGATRYSRAQRDIDAWRRQDQNRDARFTTMFDLYGLPADFPGYEEAKRKPNSLQRVQWLENAWQKDIDDWRFIPYIQLHEFEALLLSDPQQLASRFVGQDTAIQELAATTARFESPEWVNDGTNTAPSKRIIQAIPEYRGSKVSAGPIVAEHIGLSTLREKCKHFGAWLDSLEALT